MRLIEVKYMDSLIYIAAFVIFGIVGMFITDVAIAKDVVEKQTVSYFGFGIGFLMFALFYLKNIIDDLHTQLHEKETMLKSKNIVIDDLRKKLK